MSLRTILTVAMSGLTLLAVLAAASLVVLTTYLHRVASDLRANVESVRHVEEAQVDLLMHDRAVDPLVRVDLERSIRRRLRLAREHVTSADERRALAEAEEQLEAYLERAGAPKGPAGGGLGLERAFGALDELIDVNLAEARAAEAQAARWDRIGNALGTSVAAVLLIGVPASILWLRARAFRPILQIAAAMQRFASGEKEARAPESGPEELRSLAGRFNEMASSLGEQHERQMAFLAGVAHDLRNPLSALKMSTWVGRPGAPPLEEAQIGKVMALVRRQVDRLDRMVGDFLDVSRIEAGQLELVTGEHDARELARAAVDLYRGTSSAHDLRLEAPDEPLMLRGDAARIEQVLNNLVSNAIKYSPGGGEVRLRVGREAGWIVFAVRDAGVGISIEEQRRLFEPFRRTGALKSAVPGVGLGLFVVRRIVEAHGGKIDVKSAPGKGSTFEVRLPDAPAGAGERSS